MSTLATAIRIAAEVHERQRDKGGAPYVLHPLRMMMRLREITIQRGFSLIDFSMLGLGRWSSRKPRWIVIWIVISGVNCSISLR
jgi:hypothetical protein